MTNKKEPREFWILTPQIQGMPFVVNVEHPGKYSHQYIHVREVLDDCDAGSAEWSPYIPSVTIDEKTPRGAGNWSYTKAPEKDCNAGAVQLKLEVMIRRLLNKINAVTAHHRHGHEVPEDALWELSERQIDIEKELKELCPPSEAAKNGK